MIVSKWLGESMFTVGSSAKEQMASSNPEGAHANA